VSTSANWVYCARTVSCMTGCGKRVLPTFIYRSVCCSTEGTKKILIPLFNATHFLKPKVLGAMQFSLAQHPLRRILPMIAPDLRKAILEQGSWCVDRLDLIMTPPWEIEKVQDL
jgi:hypothetical protein